MFFKAKKIIFFIAIFFIAIVFSHQAFASLLSIDSPLNKKYASLVVDTQNDSVIHNINGDAKRYPASLTKMMTLYLTFEAIRKGKASFNDKVKISRKAANQPKIRLGLRRGDRVKLLSLVEATAIRSANDASVALAEHLGRNESRFARQMTAKARSLGMVNTSFRNASGLHHPKQVTTARDIAKLAIALRRNFPQYYHIFGKESFSWNGTKYKSHNGLTKKHKSIDGLKTGYINASGYNLATSLRSGNHDLVAIVLGGPSQKSRDNHMLNLLISSVAYLNGKHVSQSVSSPNNGNTSKSGKNSKIYKVSYSDTGLPTPVYWHNSNNGSGAWAIQVGAFKKKKNANKAFNIALKIASDKLQFSDKILVKGRGNSLYKARFTGLSKKLAIQACNKLQVRKASCFVFKNNNDGA